MHSIRVYPIFLLVSCICAALWTSALAQEDLMEGEPELIGVIPGTAMTRDEFRARAQAQLEAVALNAEVFRLIYSEYPTDFNELKSSIAWNIDVTNMFTGLPLSWIYFVPEADDLIPEQDLGFPMLQGLPQNNSNFSPPPESNGGSSDSSDGGEDGSGSDGISPLTPSAIVPQVLRVDPAKVENVTPGDVFLYSTAETLQILMYAPDDTVQELFHNSPHRYWHSRLQVEGGVEHWPDDLFAGQLLFFIEEMIPQSYNLMLFMSDRETLPASTLQMYGAVDRLTMAGELGFTLINPYQERQITVTDSYSMGDFFQRDEYLAVPLQFCMKGNRITTRDQLLQAQQELKDKLEHRKSTPRTRPSRPPLGGSR